MKYCPRCGEDKPATTQFWYRNNQTIDGWQGYCKACKSKLHKKYMQNPNVRERVFFKIRSWQKGVGKEAYKLSKKKYDTSAKRLEGRHERTKRAKEFAKQYVDIIIKGGSEVCKT